MPERLRDRTRLAFAKDRLIVGYRWAIERTWDVGEQKRRSAVAVWPSVAATTCLVFVLPIAVVWLLRGTGVITSGLIAAPLAACLSLLVAFAANAAWTRRRSAHDVPFGDLLLWGWIRRIRAERKLTSAAALLSVRHAEDRAAQQSILREVAAALDAQDPYLEGHSRRVARYAAITAKRMGLPQEEVARVRAAATIHDVGKLRVDDELIRKPAKLTDSEFEAIKRHAVYGADMVAAVGDPELTPIVRHHHERFDGGGYPDGLSGEQIPLGARIIAVADTFDALTSPRPYRPPTTHKRALEVLVEERGSQLDPAVVRAFLDYYRGTRGVALWALLAAPVGRSRDVVPLLVGVPLVAVIAAADVTTLMRRDPVGNGNLATRSVVPSPRPAVTPGRIKDPGRRPPRANTILHRAVDPPSPPISKTPATATTPKPTSRTRPDALSAAQRGTHTPARTPEGPRPTPTPRPISTPNGGGRPAPVKAPPTSQPAASPMTPSPPPAATPAPTPVGAPVPPAAAAPATKDDCKNGGYVNFGFPNQGSCIAAVNNPP